MSAKIAQQTLVLVAANGSFPPLTTNAAREPDVCIGLYPVIRCMTASNDRMYVYIGLRAVIRRRAALESELIGCCADKTAIEPFIHLPRN